MTRLPTIGICGPGRSGKDTAGTYLASITPLRLGRTTSQVIAPHVAHRLGIPEDEAFARRHENRQLWFDVGNELRAEDPAYLVRECLRDGEIVVGLRNADEVVTARNERLVDLFVWVSRAVPRDPTMTFGAEACDVLIDNNGSFGDLYRSLTALARFARLA